MNRKKRIIAILLAVLMLAVMLPAAHAETGSLVMKDMDQYSYSFDSSFPAPFAGESRNRSCQFWFGSTPAYCVEFGKEASTGMQYSTDDVWDGIPEADRQLLNYCLMFGYAGTCRYGAQTSQEYMATQVLVWNILTHMVGTSWEQKIVDTIAGSGSRAQDVYWKIRENVYSASKIPSFCSGSRDSSAVYDMQKLPDGGYGITLEDTNGVLANFSFASEGAEVTRDGNTLTVRTDAADGEITFSSVKQFPGWTAGAAAFWRPSSGGYQYMGSLDTGKAPDPVNAVFRLRIPAGDIEIRKTSDDGEGISGIGFTAVSQDGTVLRAVTDGTGTALLSGLEADSVWTVSEEGDTVPQQYRTAADQTVTVKAGETAVLRFHNSLKTGRIRIVKTDVSDSETGVPMKGVRFSIVSDRTGETFTAVTGDDGTAVTDDLPLGSYTVTEEVPQGYVKTQPVRAELAKDGEVFEVQFRNRIYESRVTVRKTDAGTGRSVALAGTRFRITDEEGNDVDIMRDGSVFLIETDENGEAELPAALRYGEYLLWEERAPAGYLKSEVPVRISVDPAKDSSGSITAEFPDEPARGVIVIEKKGLMLTGTEVTGSEFGDVYAPVWEQRYLQGAVFEVTAAEDIVTADGTVRLASGESAGQMVTGTDGAAVSGELFPGRYMIREISAPQGYTLMPEPVYVTVTREAAVNAETTHVTVNDEPVTMEIGFRKELEKNEFSEDLPYADTVFGLFAQQDMISPEGEVIIPAGSLMELIIPDEEGRCAAVSMLPEGAYSVRELRAAEGYLISDDELIFRTEEVRAADTPVIFNGIKRGSFTVLKTDKEDGRPLQGAAFELLTQDGQSAGSFITGEDGSFTAEDLPYGDYILRETSAPKGYRKSGEDIKFRIEEDGETVTLNVTNEFIPVPQTDGRYPLAGAAACALAAVIGTASAAVLALRRRKRSE